MRLECVIFTFENNYGPTDGRTDRRTDTTSYIDATAHLKTNRQAQPPPCSTARYWVSDVAAATADDVVAEARRGHERSFCNANYIKIHIHVTTDRSGRIYRSSSLVCINCKGFKN